MESIDQLKEAKANETDISTGIRSRRSVIESQGRDYDKQVREFQDESSIFDRESSEYRLVIFALAIVRPK